MGFIEKTISRFAPRGPAPRVPAGASVPAIPRQQGSGLSPQAAFFQQGRNMLINSWRPALRETQEDVLESWQDAAARAIEGFQNSGFLTRILEVEVGSVVGSGLRFSSRPDIEALGWTPEYGQKWARAAERAFRAYCRNPLEVDAAGRMNFDKMQQVAYASYKAYGEILALTPVLKRNGTMYRSKVAMIPPARLSQDTDLYRGIIQGVKVDEWGFAQGYVLRKYDQLTGWADVDIDAYDRDGRPNILHIFDGALSTTRGISPMAPVLKIIRQVDQYADATLTSAMIQTIFAATIKTNIGGVAAFDGLMTERDTANGTKSWEPFDIGSFTDAKSAWYDAANIDLSQHGRIAQLFPGDEFEFTQANHPGQQYDQFMGWLMREVAAGSGVTYESATGDFRGATYSSIRMGGAQEWLGVTRKRDNLIVPFCESVKMNWFDEAIYTGILDYPGGYARYLMQREAATRGQWSGPAQPQADDYKAAKAQEVLKNIQGTTLSEIASAYGRDWEDDMRQRATENEVARSLNLPLPWVPKDLMGTDKGQQAAIDATKPDEEEPEGTEKEPSAELEDELEGSNGD